MKPVLRVWNLPDDCSIEPIESFHGGVFKIESPSGQTYYLKRRPNTEIVSRESALLSWLTEHGITAAPPMLTNIGQPFTQVGDQVLALYPALLGQSGFDHYSPGGEERARGYGMGIARLHGQLADYPHAGDFRSFDILAEITEWTEQDAEQHLAGLQADHVLEAACDVTTSFSALPAHLIHRDLHPGNMLLADSQVCGYLDFDLACVGPRLFDPLYCATSMLVSGFRHEGNRTRWLPLLTSLLAGYDSIIPLQADEREAVFPILIAIQLLFLAFSCRIGSFGAAQCNADVIAWLTQIRRIRMIPSSMGKA